MKSKIFKKKSFLYRKYDLSDITSSSKKSSFAGIKTKNMYVDYAGGRDALESIPGYRKITSAEGEIHSVFSINASDGRDIIFYHSGSMLWAFDKDKRDENFKSEKIIDLLDRESCFFAKGSLAFITDGEKLVGFFGSETPRIISLEPKIAECRVMEIYDGRLFLSGNPKMPEKIFYSTSINGENIGFTEENCITCQGTGAKITGMISTGYGLWIFKDYDDGDGGIILRSSIENQNAKTDYPLLRAICGISAPYGGVMQNDRILFVSNGRLYAINDPHTERMKLEHLSAKIPIPRPGENIRLEIWMGYLAICYSGNIILASTGYEGECRLYPITDIGGHKDDRTVYRYSSVEIEGYDLSKCPDAVCHGEAISVTNEDGEIVYYEKSGEKKLLIYPTKERMGGVFVPASQYYCRDDLLWFCSEKELFIFNNDKRGVLPKETEETNPSSLNEESAYMENKIHPFYYSFGGHAPDYVIELPVDDCDCPDLKKISPPSSLAICCKDIHKKGVCIDVIRDGRPTFSGKITPAQVNFDEIDFSGILGTSNQGNLHILREGGGPFYTKQIVLYTKEHSSPFGIKYVSFRYRTMGGER